MPVYNSEHNTPVNSDHDDDINDSVTRISKLNISDPLHLHPNDSTALTVNESSIADYYLKLNALWKQFDATVELPKYVCNASESFKKHNQLMKLMQFLMGLDDSYMKIRSSILSREVLPDVRIAYATISSESFNSGPSRPYNMNNNRQGGGSGLNNNRPSGGCGLVCENYDFNEHTIDRCFKIIGYTADFRKKKYGQNVKKQSVYNNNFVRESSSSGFSDKQMFTLLSFIKDNKIAKSVQANMIGLDNVVDISHLKIKVGHPNRTEAFISNIGNLKLSNGLILYDVIVILEYCVTLISVHKMAKENKIFVVLDESKCYFVN
uniref:Ribonuclease H-like domain-containing protein n=1 Tax=Tanacetum cinerariifolium TaxID=118510 RepID=A0A699IG33_TANCI|nr:ribonuclease H-like domain-containing protein [Tanacetum cinerariifolium]